jgi:hypothetical protein
MSQRPNSGGQASILLPQRATGLQYGLQLCLGHEPKAHDTLLRGWGRVEHMARQIRNSALQLLLLGLFLAASALGTVALGPACAQASTFTVNAKSYGAVGDGHHNDTRALERAAGAAASHGGGIVEIPKGTFLVTALRIPDNVTMAGNDWRKSWIQGSVTAGSHVRLRDLKIGAGGKAFHMAPNAHDSTFTRCRFRGGGGEGSDCAVIVLGYAKGNNCRRITFKDCLVECNLGVENSAHSRDFNNISVFETGSKGGSHVSDVTFEGCHIGVSNGVRKGSPRAGIEAYTDENQGPVVHGWSNLRIINCVFEATDEFCIDLADELLAGTKMRASGPALVRGCTLKGGGKAGDARWGYTICVESPRGVVIENNTIYRGSNNTVKMGSGDMSSVDPGTIFRNNTFDLATNKGVPLGSPAFFLKGGDNRFTGNVVRTISSGRVFELQQARNNCVTGNTITLPATATLFVIDEGSSANALSPNKVKRVSTRRL